MPVREGDRIAIGVNNLPVISSSVYDHDSSWFVGSDPAPGASATFAKSARFTNVAAFLEADADNDGFGDTSQDQCPTDASTQAACAGVPPPPDDDACEKARKKLKKAKAKVERLKRKDAAAKKVKKAKKKLKKAKAAVRKAC